MLATLYLFLLQIALGLTTNHPFGMMSLNI